MFRKLVKNKKAQNTAEYAILIALVVAGIIAMQHFAQRSIQARIRDAAHYSAKISASTSQADSTPMASTIQAEPYYVASDYNITREDTSTKQIDGTKGTTGVGGIRRTASGNTVRAEGGYTKTMFNTDWGVIQ